MNSLATCPLCHPANETVLWRNDTLRVIGVDGGLHPGLTRVIWQDHVKEMTDLPGAARALLMETVWRVEQTQRDILRPDKVNLAQLGNMAPHVHWHIIPRWACDSHFPEAIWAPAPLRSPLEQQQWHARMSQIEALVPQYRAALATVLSDHS